MGNLIWHDWARFISITASIYAVWSGFFGIIFRKFFWDFVGGTMRDPGGIQPSASASVFITLIVKAPVIQCVSIIFGLFMIALEFPLPQLKAFALHRSLVLKMVLLIFQAFLTVLYYQGTNAAIYSFIAAMAYARAISLGETMEEAKSNRGKAGGA